MIKLGKALLALFMLIFLLFATSSTGRKMIAKADSTTIYVPTDVPTIQKAINKAASGDTIFVHNGIYQEDIIVNKSVSVLGENRDSTVIYGLQARYVVSITANGVSFRNFTVRKSNPSSYESGILIVSMGNTIRHNKIVGNDDGIIVSSSSRNVVSDNVISYNYGGVSFYYSSDNVFSGNVISYNFGGVNLYYSSGNVFSGNVISYNYGGVGLYRSSINNLLFHNNFNNTVQVSSDSTNTWNSNGEGNYWANYTGADSNHDGIGDEPYPVDAINEDNYPLMGMSSDFSAVLKSETYPVNIISNSTVSDFLFAVGEETGNKIIRFNAAGEDQTSGFCRITFPSGLMSYSLIVLDSEGEIASTLLSAPNDTEVRIYFSYTQSNQTITVISSKALSELLKLQADLHDLNVTHHDLLSNYDKLQATLASFNTKLADLLINYATLQTILSSLNASYYNLLGNRSIIESNISDLQERNAALNASYQEHLLDYSRNVQNMQNLLYVFAATTGIFLITTVYLSKRAHVKTNHEQNSVQKQN